MTESSTTILRRLLDERSVEWRDGSDKNVLHTTWSNQNCWFNEFPDGWTAWGMAMHGTPEQAIAATLGRGECELEIKDNMDESEGTGAVWWECSSCHWQIEFFHTKWLEHANFCPDCGAKIRKAVKR